MIISFSFTIKVMDSLSNLDVYQNMITKAISLATKHHKVNFYTDVETLSYLNITDAEVKLIDTTDFYFIDDFKVHLLSIISDEEVLIDTDLFLIKELQLKDGYDIYVDFKDNCKRSWYSEYLNWIDENNINDVIPNFVNWNIKPPNIGILKITNKELKKQYIELYSLMRQWVLSKDKNINKGISIILGQYLLGTLIQNKYNICYCCSKSGYIHLSGPIKFDKGALEKYIPNTKLI